MKQADYSKLSALEKLLAVVSMLRNQEYGCPWDLEQTISSLAAYTIEEVYEVVDAIETQDMVELEDELGDLLFQVVFYGQIAAEQGQFSFDDIAKAITHKLLRRHPHVFPDGEVSSFGRKPEITSSEVVVNWEAIKAAEREEKRSRGSLKGQQESPSLLDDVPRALPAVERARKLQKRAATAGFDWSDIKPVLSKLKEEIEEFEQALLQGEPERISDELGDIMFATINLARHAAVEPEVALRSSNRRFENRFKWIEAKLQSQGKQFKQTDLLELDALWDQAKQSGL